jgi:transcription elongation factor B subunit 1
LSPSSTVGIAFLRPAHPGSAGKKKIVHSLSCSSDRRPPPRLTRGSKTVGIRVSLPTRAGPACTMGGKYVTLVSAEGFEYVVDYEAACVSNMIKNLMTSAGGFSELESNKIKFPEISGPILEKVCQYFYYKLRHTNSKEALPQFPLPPEIALELLMAANYLDV